jgi:membrane-bound lytic murein transglycosylase MltF
MIGQIGRVLLLCVLACGLWTAASERVRAQEEEIKDVPQLLVLSGMNKDYVGDLPQLVERRVVRVLTVYSKTGYFLDGMQQRGITYEVAKVFEEFLNKDQKISKKHPIQIAMVPVSRDQLIPWLLEGRGDIVAANLTVTEERAAQIVFADPFASGIKEVLVTGPGAPALATLDDLAGKDVHVRFSSSYHDSLEKLNADFAARGLAPMNLIAADENLEDEDLLEMVSAGILPYLVADEHVAKLWAEVIPDLTLRDDLVFRDNGAIAWAVRPDSQELLAAINRFVPKAKKGTELGNTLIKRYFQANKWITNPAASEDRKRFEAAVPLFKQYAEQYGFDWVMVAAQGYQESRIDQSVKSPVGAMGVMQIKPSTAADKSVGISDISTIEPNIHAGVRYLRYIVDTYLNDPAIDDKNRLLLAFAGYNAGPGRLNTLRKKTAEDGRDPNVWFGNVEYAAAAKIGRETVTYVANIAKYYYAYRLILASEEPAQ